MMFILCCVWILLIGCSQPSVPDNTVLRIGEIQISKEEFSNRLIEKGREYDPIQLKEAHLLQKLKSDLVRELTVESFLLSAGSQLPKPIQKQEIQQEFQRQMAQYPNSQAFLQTLKTLNISTGVLKKRIRARLIKDALLSQFFAKPKIDFKKIRQRYWLEKDSFMENSRIKIQQIVAKTKHEASTIQIALKNGAVFEEVAQKYSIAEEASSGGLVGWVEFGVFPTFDAAFNLPVKRISKTLKSPYGYHILRILEKKRRRKLPLDEVKEQMSQKSLRAQKARLYTQWLETQLLKVPVKTNELAIEKMRIVTNRTYE